MLGRCPALSRALSRLPPSKIVASKSYSPASTFCIDHHHYHNNLLSSGQHPVYRFYHVTTTAKLSQFKHSHDISTRSLWSFRKKSFHDPNPDAAQAERLITRLSDPSPNNPDVHRAAELAQKSVEEGDSPRGKTLLGSLYREGLGVSKDLERAEQLFLEASEAGDPIAQCSLGVLKLSKLKSESEDDNNPQNQFDVAVAVNEKGDYIGSRLEHPAKSDDESEVIQYEKNDSEGEHGDVKKKAEEASIETAAQLVRKIRKERKKAGFSDNQAMAYEEHKEEEERRSRESIREEARKWLQLAVDQGNDTAMLALGNDLVREDIERAVELYELAAKQHRNVNAYYTLGQIYERGEGTIQRDLRASFRYFSMGAQLGDSSAQLYMGSLYHRGSFVVDVDCNLARQYVEMAVKQKDPAALHYYALMHRNGECEMEQNQEEFLKYLNAAVHNGEYGPALTIFADMYYQGSDGVEVDYAKALECFERAGRAGEVEAICSAAAMYFHGTGVKEDKRKAFELYQDAAVKGSINALRNIASMYFYGHGVPVNKHLSEHFMRTADEMEKERNLKGSAVETEGSKEGGMEIMTEPVTEVRGIVPRGRPVTIPERKTEATGDSEKIGS